MDLIMSFVGGLATGLAIAVLIITFCHNDDDNDLRRA